MCFPIFVRSKLFSNSQFANAFFLFRERFPFVCICILEGVISNLVSLIERFIVNLFFKSSLRVGIIIKNVFTEALLFLFIYLIFGFIFPLEKFPLRISNLRINTFPMLIFQ